MFIFGVMMVNISIHELTDHLKKEDCEKIRYTHLNDERFVYFDWENATYKYSIDETPTGLLMQSVTVTRHK